MRDKLKGLLGRCASVRLSGLNFCRTKFGLCPPCCKFSRTCMLQTSFLSKNIIFRCGYVSPSVGPSISMSVRQSIPLSVPPSVHQSFGLSDSPSVGPSIGASHVLQPKMLFFVYKSSFFAPKHHFSPISWDCSFLKLIFTDSSCFFMSVSPVSTKLFFEFWPKSQFSLFFFLQQQPNWKSLLKSLAVCKSVGLWPQHLKAIHHT